MSERPILALALVLHGVLLISAADEARLCLGLGDGGNFCSTSEVANGKMLSNVINAVLEVPIEGSSDFHPVAFNETISLPSDVPITTDEFDKGGHKQFEFLNGPESMAKQGDFLYASAMDGIHRINLKTGEQRKIYDGSSDCGHFCSRPLGIRIINQTIFCADLLKGLVEINLQTEKSKVLLPVGALVGGVKLTFPNDVDVDPKKQVVYLSDSGTKWGWNDFMFSLVEFDNTSRVIQYNLTSGEAEVFADGLHFANGVQISNDGKFLLVGEFTARRVAKFSLGEALPVKGSAFSPYLPGNTDNIRPSKKGGYWVALVSSRANGSRTLLEELQARPAMSKKILNWLMTGGQLAESLAVLSGNKALQELAKELKNGSILGGIMPTFGAVAELDADGNVLRVLHSTKFGDLSEVLEDDTGLYVGSYLQSGIVTLPAESVRRP